MPCLCLVDVTDVVSNVDVNLSKSDGEPGKRMLMALDRRHTF